VLPVTLTLSSTAESLSECGGPDLIFIPISRRAGIKFGVRRQKDSDALSGGLATPLWLPRGAGGLAKIESAQLIANRSPLEP